MNPTIAYVILGATVFLFVALTIFAIIWGRKIRYPSGRRLDRIHQVYGKITTIVDHKIPIDGTKLARLADAGVLAVVSVGSAWREYEKGSRWEPSVELRDYCFHFLEDADYEAAWKGDYTPWGPRTAAVAGRLRRGIGVGPAAALIRASLIDSCIAQGAPAVHEVVHALEKWDSYHANTAIWQKPGQDLDQSVEGRAYEKFKNA